jgi:hypothetical protein
MIRAMSNESLERIPGESPEYVASHRPDPSRWLAFCNYCGRTGRVRKTNQILDGPGTKTITGAKSVHLIQTVYACAECSNILLRLISMDAAGENVADFPLGRHN